MEGKKKVLIDQGGYFDGTVERMEGVMREYVELENNVMREVFTLLLKREPTKKDMQLLRPRKIFAIGEDNSYRLEIWLGRKWIELGEMERRISVEQGTYVVRFHPGETVNKTLVKAMKEMKVGPEAQGLLNRDLDGVEVGEEIYTMAPGYRYNGFFMGWIDNMTIRVSVGGVTGNVSANGWKRSSVVYEDE